MSEVKDGEQGRFEKLDSLVLINKLAKDADEKISMSSIDLGDIYKSFKTLGLNTSKLDYVNNQLILALKYLEYMQNLSVFGTSGVSTVDFNLDCTLREIIDNDG